MTRKIFKLLVLVSICTCFFPVFITVNALGTYYVINNSCELWAHSYSSSSPTNENYVYGKLAQGSDVRGVILNTNEDGTSSKHRLMLVSENDFRYTLDTSNTVSTCGNTLKSPDNNIVVDNVRYYYASSNNKRFYSGNIYESPFPVITLNYVPANATEWATEAVYYTFGEGSVEPVEPVNWGLLRDVTYQSRIAGQGSASIRNVDYLNWDPVSDANGNDISECEVEIQACYGKFTANDLTGLFELDYQDIVIEDSVSLATLPASQGTFSISWGAVIDELNGWDYQSLYAHSVNNQIQKNGWYYQIRLIGSDNTLGQWQTMYTPLSQSAQASEMILNQNSYNMSVYQIYEQLTQINNQVSITVDFNGTEYVVQNPDDGDEPQEGVDYWDILRQMLNGIVQIVGNIQKLPERLFAKIEELFTPQELDDTFHQEFTEQYEDYMASEQTTIYDFLDGVEALEPYIESLAPGDTGAHACILTWEDVTLDLTSFGAGEVTFIQGGTFSLTNAFLDVIHAFGLTYEDYEFLASAVIYLWLCVFIWHKFIHFLEKE